jgi:hypothetical protein
VAGESRNDFVAAQRALGGEWGFASFREALRSWIATVAIVEVGYVGEWEEYTHELMARDYMSEIVRLSPNSGPKVEEDLAPWDERFRAATIEEEKPHLPMANGEAGWWQYRSPRKWRRPASEEIAAHKLDPVGHPLHYVGTFRLGRRRRWDLWPRRR